MSNIELLQECKLQLEYLNQKFTATGTTNALLSKIEAALQNKVSDGSAESAIKVNVGSDAIEFGRWITEHNWAGGYNKDGEDFHFNNDFESKTVEELYQQFQESQPQQKEN